MECHFGFCKCDDSVSHTKMVFSSFSRYQYSECVPGKNLFCFQSNIFYEIHYIKKHLSFGIDEIYLINKYFKLTK